MTKINYDTLITAAAKVSSLKKSYKKLKFKTKKIKTKMKNIKIPDEKTVINYCKENDKFDIFMVPDVRYKLGDCNYHFPMKFDESYSIIKDTVSAIGDSWNIQKVYDDSNNLVGISYWLVNFAPKIEYHIPSISEWNSHTKGESHKVWVPFHYLEGSYYTNVQRPLEVWKENLNTIINYLDKFNSGIDEIINAIGTETKNMTNIYDAYKDLEKSAKNNFEGPKGKDYNKKVIAKKYAALVSAVGAANAKKYLDKILKKNTKCKISSSKVISIYKKYKKSGKISGNYNPKKKTPSNPDPSNPDPPNPDPSNPDSPKTPAGAKVVNIKLGKNVLLHKKSKITGVASAATIAAYEQTMKKKVTTIDNIKKGTTNQIKQARLDYTTTVSQINSDRDAKIANIEADKNNKIADLYSEASDKINSIDANDSTATEQIKSIKEDLEKQISKVNDEANQAIENVKAEAVQRIDNAKDGYENKVSNIQESSDKEIQNITQNGLNSETKVGKDLASFADKEPTAAEVDNSALKDANNSKADSATNLSDNQSTYVNDLSEKQQEIANISNTPPEADNSQSEPATPSVDNSAQESNSQPTTNESENVATSTSDSTESYTQSSNYSNNSNNSEPDYSSYNDNTTTVEADDSSIDTESSDIIETPAVPDDSEDAETIIPSNPNDEVEESDVDSSVSEIVESAKPKKGPNVAIPIGLGVAAAGAATVAGIRYAKNRKQNEDIDETYDDEDNNVDDYESGNDDSEYMKDDYLGPAGSMYTETDLPEDSEQSDIPDDTIYNDTDHLEEQLDDDDDTFPEDEVLNGLE